MPKYWIRFDDVCPTMDWKIWNEVESVLLRYNVKPILAVVPDNKDPYLMVDKEEKDFWKKVRRWQSLGWYIGIHGFQHKILGKIKTKYFPRESVTEFAGLSYREQEAKIEKSLEIFRNEGIETDLWIAPGHTFDDTTLKILQERKLNVVSDRFFPRITDNNGFIWIPIHFWRIREMPFGKWGFCLHSNEFKKEDLEALRTFIKKNKDDIIDVKKLLKENKVRKSSIVDSFFESIFKTLYKMKF